MNYVRMLLVAMCTLVASHAMAANLYFVNKTFKVQATKSTKLLATWSKDAGCKIIAKRIESKCTKLKRAYHSNSPIQFTWKAISRSKAKGLMRTYTIEYTCQFGYVQRAEVKNATMKGTLGNCSESAFKKKECKSVNRFVENSLKKRPVCKSTFLKSLTWKAIRYEAPVVISKGVEPKMNSIYGGNGNSAEQGKLFLDYVCELIIAASPKW